MFGYLDLKLIEFMLSGSNCKVLSLQTFVLNERFVDIFPCNTQGGDNSTGLPSYSNIFLMPYSNNASATYYKDMRQHFKHTFFRVQTIRPYLEGRMGLTI